MSIFNYKLLGKLIEEQYVNNKNFAKELNKRGVEKGEDSVKKWRQGNSVPKLLELPTIANALNINLNDLFVGFETSEILKKEILSNNNLDKILIKKFDEVSMDTYVTLNSIKNLDPKYLRVYKIRNVSLEPKFSLNDNVLLDLVNERKFKRQNGIYLIKIKAGNLIKYVKFLEDKKIKYYNIDGSEPTECDEKSCEILAKVCDKIINNYSGLEN